MKQQMLHSAAHELALSACAKQLAELRSVCDGCDNGESEAGALGGRQLGSAPQATGQVPYSSLLALQRWKLLKMTAERGACAEACAGKPPRF